MRERCDKRVGGCHFLESLFNWDVGKVLRESNRERNHTRNERRKKAGLFVWEDTALEAILTGPHTLKEPSV